MGQIDEDVDRYIDEATGIYDPGEDYEAPNPVGIHKTLSARIDEDPEYRANQYHPSTMSRNETTTIAAILELQPGDKENPTWINDEFTASVSESKSDETKTGTPYCHGTLVDPDTGAGVSFSWFGRKVFPPAGSVVIVGGKGNRLTEYNGTPQLTFGQKTTVNVVSRGNAAAQTARSGATRTQTAAAGQRAANAPGTAVLGQTVGMALNNACHFVLEEVKDPAASGLMVGTPDFYRRIWEHASAIIRISRVLEKGTLAPNPAEPGADVQEAAEAAQHEPEPEPEPETPPPRQATQRNRPAPTKSGQAFDDPGEEDVPFKGEAHEDLVKNMLQVRRNKAAA